MDLHDVRTSGLNNNSRVVFIKDARVESHMQVLIMLVWGIFEGFRWDSSNSN